MDSPTHQHGHVLDLVLSCGQPDSNIEQIFIFLPLTHLFLLCPAVFDQFELVSLASLQEIIGKMKASSCSLDIIPSQNLKKAFETIGPQILSILNSSLASGEVLQLFKHAIVEPVIKKT